MILYNFTYYVMDLNFLLQKIKNDFKSIILNLLKLC